MSKKNDLATQIDELRHCGEVIIGISDALKELHHIGEILIGISDNLIGLFSTPDEKPAVSKSAPKALPEKKELPQKEEAPLTLTQVRTILADVSRQGFSDEVRGLIVKYGADKLSDLPEECYGALIEEAEGLKNA